MRHKLYIWESLDATIKMIEFSSYKDLIKECVNRSYPYFNNVEFLESFLSVDSERTIYAFPIREYGESKLLWFDNLNFARKEKEWFLRKRKSAR